MPTTIATASIVSWKTWGSTTSLICLARSFRIQWTTADMSTRITPKATKSMHTVLALQVERESNTPASRLRHWRSPQSDRARGDCRVAMHELFGHGVLFNHVGSRNLGFSHSAGDSFAAILNDPGSRAPDRYQTFPWMFAVAPRRHNRAVAAGFGWSGNIALDSSIMCWIRAATTTSRSSQSPCFASINQSEAILPTSPCSASRRARRAT